ncbi:MAG: porin family protein [Bacteroidota bacterium]
MRTTLLLAAALAFAAVPASAQATFGLKGGLNTAFFSGGDADGTGARLGGVGGAFVRYDATPSLGLQVEALYSQEGAQEEAVGDEGTYRFDYIDIPVLVRYAVPVSQFADAGVYAGPSIGIPIRSEFEFEDGDTAEENTRTDLGVTVGVDYWSGPVGVDLRYTAGLTDATDELTIGDEVFAPLDVRNQTFTVTLGFRFGGAIGR